MRPRGIFTKPGISVKSAKFCVNAIFHLSVVFIKTKYLNEPFYSLSDLDKLQLNKLCVAVLIDAVYVKKVIAHRINCLLMNLE